MAGKLHLKGLILPPFQPHRPPLSSAEKLADLLHTKKVQIVALMGPSGVGKSTLINLLAVKLGCSKVSVDDLVESRACTEEKAAAYIREKYPSLSGSHSLSELIIDSNDRPNAISGELGPSGLGKGICFVYLYKPLDSLVDGFAIRARKNKPLDSPISAAGLGFCIESFSRFFPLTTEKHKSSQDPLTPEIMEHVEKIVSELLSTVPKEAQGWHYLKEQWEHLQNTYKLGAIYPTAHSQAFVLDVSNAGFNGKKTSENDLSGDVKALFELL